MDGFENLKERPREHIDVVSPVSFPYNFNPSFPSSFPPLSVPGPVKEPSDNHYKNEKKYFDDHLSRHPRTYKLTGDYLFFIENYFRENYESCSLFVYEEYLKALGYTCKSFQFDIEILFLKGEELIKFLIANELSGNNKLLYEFVLLMRKTNVVKAPDYFFKLMASMKIVKPSFKVSASLLTSYTTYAIKFLDRKYLKFAEDAFMQMHRVFSYIQIYLYNAMLNMYYKFSRSESVWKIYAMMKDKMKEFTPFTYGSLMETCLYIDHDIENGLFFYKRFREHGFDEKEKHVKYVSQLGKKIESMNNGKCFEKPLRGIELDPLNFEYEPGLLEIHLKRREHKRKKKKKKKSIFEGFRWERDAKFVNDQSQDNVRRVVKRRSNEYRRKSMTK